MSLNKYEAALVPFRDAIGPENVITAPNALRAAETSTFLTRQKIPGILRPANRPEVQECLRIANRFQVPLYPVSSGKNWGYGSRVPASDGCFLLDLGRMNRILDFNEKLAYVTVEPGVTQGQLYRFLQERQSRLWMDATGASPECSIIGNTMERGFGHTPYGDHFAHTCGLELVLPTGEVFDSGFAGFPGAHAAATYHWGVGPSLDALFSQSNFGVVTRMTVWLMPAPEYFQAYYFRCANFDDVMPLIDALRPLRLDDTIRGASHIVNDYKVLSALRQYPWEETAGSTPLRAPLMEKFRRELKIGVWNGSGALYGTKAQVREARRLLRRALRGTASKLQFLDDRMLRLASLFATPYQLVSGLNLRKTLAVLKPIHQLMKGVPTDYPMASTYWRKRTPPPAAIDPDRDGCGLLWCSPVAPADGYHAHRLTGMTIELLSRHGFEPMISVTMISARALACVVSIAFDREVEGEDERAMNCYQDLLQSLASAGYYSYRLSVAANPAAGRSAAYTDLLGKIKQALDPNGILAPGRYLMPPAGKVDPQLTGTAAR